jgi:hypothetical protein
MVHDANFIKKRVVCRIMLKIGCKTQVRIEYSRYLLKSKNETLSYLSNKLKNSGFIKPRMYKYNNLRFNLMNHGTLEAEK